MGYCPRGGKPSSAKAAFSGGEEKGKVRTHYPKRKKRRKQKNGAFCSESSLYPGEGGGGSHRAGGGEKVQSGLCWREGKKREGDVGAGWKKSICLGKRKDVISEEGREEALRVKGIPGQKRGPASIKKGKRGDDLGKKGGRERNALYMIGTYHSFTEESYRR